MNRPIALASALALVYGFGACATSQPPAEHRAPNQPVWVPPPPRPVWGSSPVGCPPSALLTLDTQETQDEIAVIFTVVRGDVGLLREQVQLMADRINRGGPLDPLPSGEPFQGTSPSAPHGAEPAVQALATVEPIEGGARLVLTAIDPAREEQLREQVRSYALKATRCPEVGG